MDTDFCVDALEKALQRHGAQEIFNTEGVQFTSEAFTSVLKGHGIQISMDGKGYYHDNIFVSRSGAASNTSVFTLPPSRMDNT